jgi:hypothetical protein
VEVWHGLWEIQELGGGAVHGAIRFCKITAGFSFFSNKKV